MDYINLDINGKISQRFDAARFFGFRENYYDVASSVFLERIPLLPQVGEYTITDDPYRPDMISHGIYGDTQYWWLLMVYNDEIFLENLTLRRKLRFFSLGDLDELFYEIRRLSLPRTVGVPRR